MAYRSPSPPDEQPPRVVRYGRFGPNFLELLLVAGFLGLGSTLTALVAGSSESLVCTRAADDVRCVHERSTLLGDRVRRFTGDDIAAIEWVAYEGDEGADRGRTEIFDRTGRPMSVAAGDRDEARESYERIAAFFADPAQPRLEVDESTWWGAWLIGPGFALAGLVLLGAALRRPTSVRLVVHPSRHSLEVVERWLGVPRRRRELSLEDVKRVDVERGHVKRLYHRNRHAGDLAGFLVLRYEDGESLRVTDLLPGMAVHERAAEALRRELGLVRIEPAAQERAPDPAPPPPARVPEGPHSPKRILKWWLTTIAVVTVIGFGIELVVTSGDGRLHVVCEHRCRFDGFDCRPGGEMAMSKPPGDHVIEVFDPDHRSGWRPVTVAVREGETTTFRCR